MPYINCKVSVPLTAEKETALKEALGKAISLIPGKTESWLMVSIESGAHLWLGGKNDQPHAMVETKVFGSVKPKDVEDLTAGVCDLLKKQLGIEPENVYLTCEGYENWGWNRQNLNRS